MTERGKKNEGRRFFFKWIWEEDQREKKRTPFSNAQKKGV
jgi:hypothetical protein